MIAWFVGGWLVASAIGAYLITRWFRQQRDLDETQPVGPSQDVATTCCGGELHSRRRGD